MLKNFFPIPDDVIWQMGLDDLDDDGENYADHGGGSLPYPMQYTSHPPRKSGAKAPLVKCPNCGAIGLKNIQTPDGPDLAYASGPLAGKLHACP